MKHSVNCLANEMAKQVEVLADLKQACQEAKDSGFLNDEEQEIVNAYIESVCNPWGIIHRFLGQMDEAEKAEKKQKKDEPKTEKKKPEKVEKKKEEETAQTGLSFLD